MTVLEARYELGHRIGGGGMAEVVEAYDRKLDRRVAVKLLRDGASGSARTRTLRARGAGSPPRLDAPERGRLSTTSARRAASRTS